MEDLPIYEIELFDEETLGVYRISLVERPAIQTDFVALSAQDVLPVQLSTNTLYELTGPVLIPDQLIYRRDEKSGKEFYITFSADTVKRIAQRFHKSTGETRSTNLQHGSQTVECTVVESWIKQGVDKSQNYGYDLPNGTWFVTMKVENPSDWTAYVETGKIKGFSIEGSLAVERSVEMHHQLADALQLLSEKIDSLNKRLPNVTKH